MADGFFSKLKEGLSKTRNSLISGLDSVFGGATEIDNDFYEEIEEILVCSDVGANATEVIVEELKAKIKDNHIKVASEAREQLKTVILDVLKSAQKEEVHSDKKIIFLIGVNGAGKTTSIGKLAHIYKNAGKKVLIVAADTFRAAASAQLEVWAERADVPIISCRENQDPSGVVFDGLNAARARNTDVLLIDTAGRLQNKKNLMDELSKMNRVIDKADYEALRENYLVLDAATGQNAMVQAKEFAKTSELNGIILTKMDGTAKGGIVIAIAKELGIPVKYIGVGEGIDDLQPFDPDSFVNALFE